MSMGLRIPRSQHRGAAGNAMTACSKRASVMVVTAWLAMLAPQASAQTPFDSQHCPPVVPCKDAGVLPVGCTCDLRNEQTAPPPLPAPTGCDPEEVKKQISTLIGTIKFVTAPHDCAITPDQCQALPGRHVQTLGDGTMVCAPDKCSKSCYKFGATKAGPFSFGGIDVCSTCLSLPIDPRRSFDPNDKMGPAGVAEAQFVRGDTPLRYTVHFENLSTATAAAQVVVVTDQLDPQQVDLGTFRLGPISFGDNTLVPAPGVRGWSGSVDFRPAQDIVVAISAGIDASTGLVTWRFTSLDPDTEQLTDDPEAGFLPPNTAPPAGEGSVSFTVMPKTGLATATTVRNQAVVVFDTNAPIATPTWLNTIDNDPPTTHVLPLAATQTSPGFTVQWSGSDIGSGVGAYTVLVSDNGGPFKVWLDATPATSGFYTGEIGHTYGFMSIGEDLVGNVEPLKSVAEATTQVVSAPTCAADVSARVQVTRSGFGYNFAIQRFVQTVTLKNVSAASIAAPLSLVLDNLSSVATLYNATGMTVCATPGGSPFMNWLSSLAPGASASIVLQFTDPTKAGITYATRVLAGSGGR